MKIVTVCEAKLRFSELVIAAIQGEETLIIKAGKPAAKLVAATQPKIKRKFGVLKGKIRISDNFDEPLPRF